MFCNEDSNTFSAEKFKQIIWRMESKKDIEGGLGGNHSLSEHVPDF